MVSVYKEKKSSGTDKHSSKAPLHVKHKDHKHSLPMPKHMDDDDEDEEDDPDFDGNDSGSDEDDGSEEDEFDEDEEDEEEDDENENASMDASDDDSSSGESEIDRMVKSVPRSKDNIADDEAHDLDSGSDDEDAYVDMQHRQISKGKHSFLSHYYMLTIGKLIKTPDDLLKKENRGIFSSSDRKEYKEFKENNIVFGVEMSRLISSLNAQFKTSKPTALSCVMNKLQHATKVCILALDDIVEQSPGWKSKSNFVTCNISNVKLMADKTKTAKNIMHTRGFVIRFTVAQKERRFVVSNDICILMVAYLYIVNILKIMEADVVDRLADVPENVTFVNALRDFMAYDTRETITSRYRCFIRQLSNIKSRFPSLEVPMLFQEDINDVYA